MPVRRLVPAIWVAASVVACGSPGATTPRVTAVATGPDAPSTAPAQSPSEDPDTVVRDGEGWLAYQWISGNGDGVFLIRLDGTGGHQIAADAEASQIHPDWSPDGSQVAFVAITRDDRMNLWIVDADGRNARQLVACDRPCNSIEYPDWSPDGAAIYFGMTSDADPGGIPRSFGVGRYDIASGETKIVVERTDGMTLEQPRVSADGTRLVYTRFKDPASATAGSAIFLADLDGGSERRLTEFADYGAHPDWSVDDRIVFNTRDLGAFQESGEPANLYLIDPDGGDLTPLTDFGTDLRATQPRWTPDGSAIVFTRVAGDGFGERRAAIIEANGSGLRSLLRTPVDVTHPQLRPLPG